MEVVIHEWLLGWTSLFFHCRSTKLGQSFILNPLSHSNSSVSQSESFGKYVQQHFKPSNFIICLKFASQSFLVQKIWIVNLLFHAQGLDYVFIVEKIWICRDHMAENVRHACGFRNCGFNLSCSWCFHALILVIGMRYGSISQIFFLFQSAISCTEYVRYVI